MAVNDIIEHLFCVVCAKRWLSLYCLCTPDSLVEIPVSFSEHVVVHCFLRESFLCFCSCLWSCSFSNNRVISLWRIFCFIHWFLEHFCWKCLRLLSNVLLVLCNSFLYIKKKRIAGNRANWISNQSWNKRNNQQTC